MRRRRPVAGADTAFKAWLSSWGPILCEEAAVASCQFGSLHRKEFKRLVQILRQWPWQ